MKSFLIKQPIRVTDKTTKRMQLNKELLKELSYE